MQLIYRLGKLSMQERMCGGIVLGGKSRGCPNVFWDKSVLSMYVKCKYMYTQNGNMPSGKLKLTSACPPGGWFKLDHLASFEACDLGNFKACSEASYRRLPPWQPRLPPWQPLKLTLKRVILGCHHVNLSCHCGNL